MDGRVKPGHDDVEKALRTLTGLILRSIAQRCVSKDAAATMPATARPPSSFETALRASSG
jgi:hypothetical protein